MKLHIYTSSLLIIAHVIIIISLSLRVIMKRRPVGVSLAWLVLIFMLPFAGALLYLFVGERRLGRKRVERERLLSGLLEDWLRTLPEESRVQIEHLSPQAAPISHLVEGTIGMPAMAGNELRLLEDAESILRSMIDDIERARDSCHMEFYIWNEGGTADQVCEALIRASKRGVACRVLVDAVGSAKFLKGAFPGRFRDNGIALVEALPVGPMRTVFVRPDVRLHRKIAVLDSRVAYTGSLNLVDPRFFKQEAGVGQWVDAMARVEGPAVQGLEALFSWDWEMESGQRIHAPREQDPLGESTHRGAAAIQVVPSGPGDETDRIHRLMLTTVYAAQRELMMTTPYFVPDDALMSALLSAAQRGVEVTIILPEKIDSLLVRYACRSYFDDLLSAGVRILRFQRGLLHTKSITVDGEIALFGTVNLDMRSFWLDYEVTLCVYDKGFAASLRVLQQKYAEKSRPVGLDVWRKRPLRERFIENVAQLFSPLL